MSCTSLDPPSYCSNASPELKLYHAFIFSVPVFFTFILLLLFYVFYLRRRRANWQSLRMRASHLTRGDNPRPSDSGIKKEVREMLPVVVFKESFLIRETQCSVCLGDYQSDERLQRIPPCGHTFHVDCIDHWLATNTTCPLCRVSLLPAAKSGSNTSNIEGQATQEREVQEQLSGSHTDVRIIQHDNEAEHRERVSGTEDLAHLRREVEEFRHDREACVVIDVEAPGCAQESLRP